MFELQFTSGIAKSVSSFALSDGVDFLELLHKSMQLHEDM